MRILIVFLLAVALMAQVAPTGALVGEVKDASGALVPGASVVLTNTGTQVQKTTQTSADGHFAFTLVPVGVYQIDVSSSGFARYQQTGIRVDVDSTPNIPVTLQVSSTNEQVTVTADAAMVTTETGTLGQVVRERYIQDLPLNGRNAATLLFMVPGTINGVGTTTAGYANTDETIAVSVNGARGNEVNFKLDGATHMDNVTNLNATYPNPDAISEFSVQTSNFSAQYGNASGATVSMVTRSGTNVVHGSVFEYLRNDTLNARNFFATRRGNLKRNQFGGSAGGPVKHNKLFFFASYQGTPSRQTTFSNVAFVPSRERVGDFTAQSRDILDPDNNNRPFPGKIIPASRILPIATNILEKVPGAGTTGGTLLYGRPSNTSRNQALGKLDYNSTRHTISGSFFYNIYKNPGWDGDGTLLTAEIGQVQTTKSTKFQDVITLRPNLLNTLVASTNTLQSYNTRTSLYNITDFGPVKIAIPSKDFAELELSVTGSSGWGSVSNSPPGEWIRDTVEISDTVSYTHGKHAIVAGVEFMPFTKFDSTTNFQQSGNFTFTGQITNVGIADLLLGKVSTFTQSAGKYKRTSGKQISAFIDDKFRVRSNLVLNLGLRWDPFLPYHDGIGQVTGFRPGYHSQRFPNAPAGMIFAGDPGFPEGGMYNDWNYLAPRFGFAWSPVRNAHPITVRGGYGLFFVRPFPRLYNNFVENAPFSPSVSLPGVDLMDPYGSAGVRNPFPPFAPVPLSKDTTFVVPTGLTYFREDWGVGYSQAWNLTVERQMLRDLLLRAAYVGNKGTHLQSFRQRNAAVYIPSATLNNTNQRRPLAPNYASVIEMVSDGNSQYHALQLSAEKRMSRNFSLLAYFTWSKSIDDESFNAQFTLANPNPYDPHFNRGLSDFDIPRSFRLTGIYDLPRLKGSSRLVRGVAGGWTITEIFDWRNGLPFSLSSGRDNSFSGIGADRADLKGDPALPRDRARKDLIRKYFDQSLVTANAIGTFGNSPRNFLRGLRYFNLDSGIHKKFQVTERFQMQFRGEFFNTLNAVNLNNPGTNSNSPASFGIITGAGSPRIAQLSLRIQF
jgi:hypothetical protein